MLTMVRVVKFAKVRCVKSPKKGTRDSAGYDFFIPNCDAPRVLKPLERVVIPSGIHVQIPEGYFLQALDRSSMAVNKGIRHIAGTIDQDYQGEIGIALQNMSEDDVTIYPGEKVIQYVLLPCVSSAMIMKTSLDSLYPTKTSRGNGGFGSTGNGLVQKFWANRLEGQDKPKSVFSAGFILHYKTLSRVGFYLSSRGRFVGFSLRDGLLAG